MRKIHKFILNTAESDVGKIIIELVKIMPKTLYITHNVLFCDKSNSDKCTMILSTLNTCDIIVIKIYKDKIFSIPEELVYLSTNYKNHYFYTNCYLAYCKSINYSISVIKCKKADGDISNLKFTVENYNKLNEDISDELFKMHTNKFVHCDIKPSNIIYKKTHGEIKFGLCDFDLVTKGNYVINSSFRRYYKKLYNVFIPNVYTIDFENEIFIIMLNILKKHKKIKANTI